MATQPALSVVSDRSDTAVESDVVPAVAPAPAARPVPHSIETEQALLGLLMLDNQLFDLVEPVVQADHFYMPFHAAVFEAIKSLLARGWEATPLTIRETLPNKAVFEQNADLLATLTQLAENGSALSDIRSLAGIIRTYAIQRQLIEISAGVVHDIPADFSPEATEDLINRTESRLFQLAETGNSRNTSSSLGNPLKQVIERAEAARKRQSHLTGITTGFIDLDRRTGGLQKSDLIILAARPGMGKTSIALNMAYNAARALSRNELGGMPVGFFTLEMSADQLATRLLASATGIDSTRIQQGQIKNEEFDRLVAAAGELSELKFYVDETPQLHLGMLRSRARRMVRQYGVGLIMVDYLQLMQGPNRSNNDFNRVQEISEISKGLKGIARELDVPVLAMSQLSRAVESRDNKRPQLSDLRESGSIEQDADIVMFLYREEYYLQQQLGALDREASKTATAIATQAAGVSPIPGKDKKLELADKLEAAKGKAELLISKNRKGATGALSLYFSPETTTFHDLTDRPGDPFSS